MTDPAPQMACQTLPKTVSVIIPALNEERFLGACLRSIKDTAGDFVREVLVVDNGSTDNTVAIAQQHGAQVIHSRVATIAAQRNLGVRQATGELLAFLDADCTVEPGWAETATKHFRDATVVAVGAPPRIPTSDTTWLQQAWSFLKRKASATPIDVSWIASANLWVRKTSFTDVDGFDETLETCEDADLGYRLKKLGRIVSDPRVTAVHHREPRTVYEFYKKEIWHGKNSFDGLARGRLRLAELPSLLAPLQLGASILLACVGVCLAPHAASKWLVPIGLAGVFAAPVLYTLRACAYKGNWRSFHRYTLVYLVYFVARLDALLRWIYGVARSALS